MADEKGNQRLRHSWLCAGAVHVIFTRFSALGFFIEIFNRDFQNRLGSYLRR